jgi:hypothetical protein
MSAVGTWQNLRMTQTKPCKMLFQPVGCGLDVATMLGLGRDGGEAEWLPQFSQPTLAIGGLTAVLQWQVCRTCRTCRTCCTCRVCSRCKQGLRSPCILRPCGELEVHRVGVWKEDTPMETMVLEDFYDKGIGKGALLPLSKHLGVNVDG